MANIDFTGYFEKVATDMSATSNTCTAATSVDYTGYFNNVVEKTAAKMGTYSILGNTFKTDAFNRMASFAKKNPMQAMGRAAGAGALGAWAIHK